MTQGFGRESGRSVSSSSSFSSIFLAAASRTCLFFSIILCVAQCSILWCNGTSNAAITTMMSSMPMGEWCVRCAMYGCNSRFKNSNDKSNPMMPRILSHFSPMVTLWLNTISNPRKMVIITAMPAYCSDGGVLQLHACFFRQFVVGVTFH